MTLYEQVVTIGKPYLGPATEQFIARQCKLLKIDAPALANAELADLAYWVEVGAKLVMDPQKAKELASKVKSIH
jgi:hypothetical protein